MADQPPPEFVVLPRSIVQSVVDTLQQVAVPGPVYESVLKPAALALSQQACDLPPELLEGFKKHRDSLIRAAQRRARAQERKDKTTQRITKKAAKKKGSKRRR